MRAGRYVLTTVSRLLTARLIYRLLYAISVILVSNYLITEPSVLDAFDVATALVSVLMIASEVGMSMVVMRSGAQHDEKKLARYYGTALAVETVAWMLLYGGALSLYALSSGVTEVFWLIAILGIGQAVIQYRVVFRSIYRGLYKKEWITYIEIIDGALKLAGVYYITTTIAPVSTGVYWIAGWHTITTIIFVALYGANTLRYVKPTYDKTLLQPMLREGVWFSMQAIVMTAYFEIDKLILRLFQTTGWAEIPAGDIGRYTAAARLVVFVLIFHRIGLQVITPYLYASFQKHKDKYRRIVQLSTKYLGALGIGMGVGLTLLAPDIINLLYKPELSTSAEALRWFGVFVTIRFIGITSSQVFATSERQPLRTKLEFGSVIFNIVLDIFLIPAYGFVGGAIATVFTELSLQAVLFVIARKPFQGSLLQDLMQLIPASVAALMMVVTVLLLQPHLHVLLVIVLGAAAYAGGLFLFRFIHKSDLRLLQGQPQ